MYFIRHATLEQANKHKHKDLQLKAENFESLKNNIDELFKIMNKKNDLFLPPHTQH